MLLKKIFFPVLGVLMILFTVAVSCLLSVPVVNRQKYSVFGVDVSRYQGVIDWNALQQQDVKFAFIKATEGSGHVDEYVSENLENAGDTDIKISCYHFFSFDSSGETQAENFIKTVSKDKIDMPPVVDIEYYADKADNKPSFEETEKILTPLLSKLENYYGVKPIIYSTIPVYCRYIMKKYSDYPLWIRSVTFEPDLMDWKFWQYDDSGTLDGYVGDEKCIDFNVYNGKYSDFVRYIKNLDL